MLLKELKSKLVRELSVDPNIIELNPNRYNDSLGRISISSNQFDMINLICQSFFSSYGFTNYNFGDFMGLSKDSDHFLLELYNQNGKFVIDVTRNNYIESPF